MSRSGQIGQGWYGLAGTGVAVLSEPQVAMAEVTVVTVLEGTVPPEVKVGQACPAAWAAAQMVVAQEVAREPLEPIRALEARLSQGRGSTWKFPLFARLPRCCGNGSFDGVLNVGFRRPSAQHGLGPWLVG